MTAPLVGIAGQPIDVGLNVKNEGVADVDKPWADKIYLSADFTLDFTDFPIGTQSRTPSLAPGSNYVDTIESYLPITLV